MGQISEPPAAPHSLAAGDNFGHHHPGQMTTGQQMKQQQQQPTHRANIAPGVMQEISLAKPHTIQYHPAPGAGPPGYHPAPALGTPSSHTGASAPNQQQQQQQQIHFQAQPPPQQHNSIHHAHAHHQQQQQQQPVAALKPDAIIRHHSQQAQFAKGAAGGQPVQASAATRLTLPLVRNAPLVGPFRLEHGAQYDSRVFHIKAQLMETLNKSRALTSQPNQQQPAAVIQELQFRAYLINPGQATTSPTAKHHHHHHHSNPQGDSLLAHPPGNQAVVSRACNWPELFHVTINGQPVHLERGPIANNPRGPTQANANVAAGGASAGAGQHVALDVFPYCHLGDNMIEFQVNDCYCNHEFVLELVDRPTLKAFINSCFKSRLLSQDSCLSKLKFNFGSPGFIPNLSSLPGDVVSLLQSAGIFNEYVSDTNIQQQQDAATAVAINEQQQITRVKISMRCPISARRMATPARGPSCKHLQCFDLENFLYAHRDRTSWSCPICAQPVQFNMLELDAHQMGILQQMADIQATTDDVLIEPNGQWQAYYNQPSQQHQHHLTTAHSLPVQLNQNHHHHQAHNEQLPQALAHNQQQQQQQHHHHPSTTTTAKANGTFHPQAAPNQQQYHAAGSPMPRPMSGHRTPGSPASWSTGGQQPTPLEGATSRSSPLRRPPSAVSGGGGGNGLGSRTATPPATGRRSANNSTAPGGPPTKRPYLNTTQATNQQAQLVVANQAVPASSYFEVATNDEDLSPLAAMERTIIQHEQQMGPPPFDPNSLTSSPLRNTQVQMQQQQQQQQQQQSQPQAAPVGQSHQVESNFSPSSQTAVASPIQRANTVPASPLGPTNNRQQPPQSPHSQQQTHLSSMPATPIVLAGPETPATPGSISISQQLNTSNSQGSTSVQQQQQQSPHHVISSNNNSNSSSSSSSSSAGQCVEHQPLSNGSASAASITSCSTMTPGSGHSLGSVGMGGDSRCNTAPLQSGLCGSLDDLILPSSSQNSGTSGRSGDNMPGSLNQCPKQQSTCDSNQHPPSVGGSDLMGAFDDKNEILMSKLMMDSDDSMLNRNNDLALALEEAQWKQQLDRGKSEHLANFLNDPLMMNNSNNKKHLLDGGQYHSMDGANKMLSGGLNPSDDEGGQHSPHGSATSPSDVHNLQGGASGFDQPLDHFANYLDSGSANDGAGLPPDDSILDLFER